MTTPQDFIIRTEDIRPEEILDLFVPIQRDREIVDKLKSTTPIILEGSRGTGKSLLLRVCEQEQFKEFGQAKVLPVYVSFVRSSLLNTSDPRQFQHWMLARLCSRITRVLGERGFNTKDVAAIRVLIGGEPEKPGAPTKLESLAQQFEDSYKTPGAEIDTSQLPSVDLFKEAIEDLCRALDIRRLNVLFDEATHIFRPEQQRQFFTLFRDLRSPYMTCNAAVYPGVTSYGDSFETVHDAQIVSLHREITSPDYVAQMQEVVFKQAEAKLQEAISRRRNNFAALAYAVSGNPRLLLKTIASAGSLTTSEIEKVIREFFRFTIWSEHSGLVDRYPGHKALIDWGRDFIERHVIPETNQKNQTRITGERSERTCYIWVHRDAPEAVREALRLLMYTGVITKLDSGVVATRSELGTRYSVNIGCLAATGSAPIAYILDLMRGLGVKRFTEYGANFSAFSDIAKRVGDIVEADISTALVTLLKKPVSVLDLSTYQKGALNSIGIDSIGKALKSTEADFKRALYIGPKRSRRIMNVVTAAVYEYLSG